MSSFHVFILIKKDPLFQRTYYNTLVNGRNPRRRKRAAGRRFSPARHCAPVRRQVRQGVSPWPARRWSAAQINFSLLVQRKVGKEKTLRRGRFRILSLLRTTLIETAKGGRGSRRCRWQKKAASPLRSRALGGPRRSRPGKGIAVRWNCGPPLGYPRGYGDLRSHRRGDPRGRPKKNGLPRRFAPRNDVEKGNPLRSAEPRPAPKAAPSEAAPRGIGSARLFNDCDRIRTMSDDRDDQLGHGTQVHRVGALFSLESKNRFSFRARPKREMGLDLRRNRLASRPPVLPLSGATRQLSPKRGRAKKDADCRGPWRGLAMTGKRVCRQQKGRRRGVFLF